MPRRWPQLMRAFVEARVKPYYLHHLDLAPGTSHFRTTIAEGQALMRALRGRLSGLAQPTYVLDIPGGHGKVPIGPGYLAEDGSDRRSGGRRARLSGAGLNSTGTHALASALLARLLRFEGDLELVAGGPRKSLECSHRRLHTSALEPRDHGSRRFHSRGKLLLRKIGSSPRANQRLASSNSASRSAYAFA